MASQESTTKDVKKMTWLPRSRPRRTSRCCSYFFPLQLTKTTRKTHQKTIIIKFVRSIIFRNDVFFSKRKLAGTGMMIRESLTKRRMQIFRKSTTRIWCGKRLDCQRKSVCFYKEEKHLIKCSEDIDNLAV